MKIHRYWLPGRLLCPIRSNRKWCKRRGSSLECQNCFFVYPIIDSNLKNLLLTLYFINKKNGRFFPEFLLKSCKAYFHKIHFTFSYITLPTEHSPNPQRSAKSIFSLFLYKTILFDLQSQKATSKLCFFIIDLISTTPLSTISVYTFPLDVLFCICLFQMLCNFYCFLDLIFS